MKKLLLLFILLFFMFSCDYQGKIDNIIGDEKIKINNKTGKIDKSISSKQKVIPNYNENNIGINQLVENIPYTETKIKETDFVDIETYGIEFILKKNNDGYELLGNKLGDDTISIEVLSCLENNSEEYDKSWYKIKNFNKGDNNFKYIINKEYNNFCLIPYKIKLITKVEGEHIIRIDLKLGFLTNFIRTSSFIGKKISIGLNLNTFTVLQNHDKGGVGIDKNNLYVFYSGWPQAHASSHNINDYKSYKYHEGMILGDNFEFYRGEKGLEIDLKTFVSLGNNYFKDKDNYYQLIGKLSLIGTNKNELNILSNKVYLYDNNLYYLGSVINDVDYESFTLVKSKELFGSISVFGKDKNSIFLEINEFTTTFYGKIDSDYDSSKKISVNKFIDNQYIYTLDNGKITKIKHSLKGKNIKVLSDKLLADNYSVIYLFDNQKIISFDKKSFVNVRDLILLDKEKVYFGNIKTDLNASDVSLYKENGSPLIFKNKDKLYFNCMIGNISKTGTKNKPGMYQEKEKYLYPLLDYFDGKISKVNVLTNKKGKLDKDILNRRIGKKAYTGWEVLDNVDFETFLKVENYIYKDKNQEYNFKYDEGDNYLCGI